MQKPPSIGPVIAAGNPVARNGLLNRASESANRSVPDLFSVPNVFGLPDVFGLPAHRFAMRNGSDRPVARTHQLPPCATPGITFALAAALGEQSRLYSA
jgi:hypothetical protein